MTAGNNVINCSLRKEFKADFPKWHKPPNKNKVNRVTVFNPAIAG